MRDAFIFYRSFLPFVSENWRLMDMKRKYKVASMPKHPNLSPIYFSDETAERRNDSLFFAGC